MRIEATKKLFTVDELYRMDEAGIFKPEDRVELIEGEIILMPMIGPRHAAAVDRATKLFILSVGDAANVRGQNPARLDDYNQPLPDLLLLKPRADFYAARHPAGDEICLAIEISDTTLRYDRNTKMPIYAKLGIRESWVVDLNGDVILVFRDLAPNGYKTSLTVRRGETISPLAFPDLVISVDQLLG